MSFPLCQQKGFFISNNKPQTIAEFTPIEYQPIDAHDLPDLEKQVLWYASLGGTTKEVSDLLSVDTERIEKARRVVNAFFDLKNKSMAFSVSRAIGRGILQIESEYATQKDLSEDELAILGLIASGVKGKRIPQYFPENPYVALYSGRIALFDKIEACGEVHSVRRAHELGIPLADYTSAHVAKKSIQYALH